MGRQEVGSCLLLGRKGSGQEEGPTLGPWATLTEHLPYPQPALSPQWVIVLHSVCRPIVSWVCMLCTRCAGVLSTLCARCTPVCCMCAGCAPCVLTGAWQAATLSTGAPVVTRGGQPASRGTHSHPAPSPLEDGCDRPVGPALSPGPGAPPVLSKCYCVSSLQWSATQ